MTEGDATDIPVKHRLFWRRVFRRGDVYRLDDCDWRFLSMNDTFNSIAVERVCDKERFLLQAKIYMGGLCYVSDHKHMCVHHKAGTGLLLSEGRVDAAVDHGFDWEYWAEYDSRRKKQREWDAFMAKLYAKKE